MIAKLPIQTKDAPDPVGPYNQAVQVGDFLFISGQIALDPATKRLVNNTLQDEVHMVMKNLGAILQSQGMTHDHIVKTSIFLKNMDDFATVNEIYGSYFSGNYPARETVEVSRLPLDVNVEVSVIAVKG